MNAESPDPRSIRKFSSRSQVAAFTSHNSFYWKMLKKTLKNHSGIDEKSMKKCIDFLIDFFIDFWKVFGRVSGCILALKIDEKCIETLMKKIIDFCMFF